MMTPSDFDRLSDESPMVSVWLCDYERYMSFRRSALRGLAATLVNDGSLAACAGVIELWAGVGEAWLATVPGHECGVGILMVMRRLMRTLDAMGAYHRVQAIVPEANISGGRLALLLGFKAEGVLHKYTQQGHDCVMFARVR